MIYGMNKGESKMKHKSKNKKTQIIVGMIVILILLILILCGANTDILNQVSDVAGLNIVFEDKQQEAETVTIGEFIAEDKLKVYFIDVGQADSILVMNQKESMLIDAGNNENGEDVVSFIKEKGIQKLNYVIRNPSTRRPYRRTR